MAVTDYTTIKLIRQESGFKPQREYREPVGKGNGTRTEFALNYAGGAKFDVLVSRDQLGSVADEDIDVFIGNTYTREDEANYSVDTEEGILTLTSPPANNVSVFVTYWHSILSDVEVTECLTWAMDWIDRETNQSYYTGGDTQLTYSESFDGDGLTKSFRLSRGRISTLDSYDIDGVTSGLVEDDDYFLYPIEHRIAFKTAPTNNQKNISITYSYGVLKSATVEELASLVAAKKAIGLAIGRTGKTGVATGKGSKRSFREANRPVTQTKLIDERIVFNLKSLGFKKRLDLMA